MSSLPYLHFTETVNRIGELFTLVINSFLIWITVFHIKNIKGGYRILVLALANLEILFAFLEFLFQPFVHSYNSSYVYFTIAPVHGASKAFKTGALCLYSGIYCLLISLIAIQFFYRYCLITGPKVKVIKWIDRGWWVYCSFWSGIFMYAYWICVPDKDSVESLRKAMLEEYNSDVEEVAALVIMVYNPKTGQLRSKTLLTIATFVTSLAIQYLLIIVSGIEIHLNINKTTAGMSKKAHKMQRQLFKTLIFQILNPFIFHHIPAAFLLITPFMDLLISIPSGLIFCFYSIFPPIDSLVMMCLVTEYRVVMGKRMEIWLLKIVHWLQKLGGKDDDTTTTTTT